MIIKTKENPLGAFLVGTVKQELGATVDALIVEAAEAGSALAGLPDTSLLENSDIATTSEDLKVAATPITSSDVTSVLGSVRGQTPALRNAIHGLTGVVVISPAGVERALGALAVNYPILARTGLALPTVKGTKFTDFDTTLFENMGMVAASKVTLANITNQTIRLGYFYHVESILMWYVANLNRLVANMEYVKHIGPRVGMASYAGMGINDEENQRLLGEIISNISDLPVFDVESYDRINEFCKYSLSLKKTSKTPACIYFPLLIGTTLPDIVLTGLLADGGDPYWKTTFANYGSSSGILGTIADRCMHTDILSTALFATGHTTARQVGVKTLLDKMALHTKSLKSVYTAYFQYIRFAVSKGWITPHTVKEFLKWDISATNEINPRLEPVVYSHNMATFINYLPMPMSFESENNTGWARFNAPLLLDATSGKVSSLSLYGDLKAYVDNRNLATKEFAVAEKASWGLWTLKVAGSTSAQTLSEKEKALYVNPLDGLAYTGMNSFAAINSSGVCSLSSSEITEMYIMLEDVNHLNVCPFLHMSDGTINHIKFETLCVATNASVLDYVGSCRVIDAYFVAFGMKRTIRFVTNVALYKNFTMVLPMYTDDATFVSISVLDFSRAALNYAKVSNLLVNVIANKVA